MLTQESALNIDMAELESRGITIEQVASQIDNFKKGFPFMKLAAPATPEKILVSLNKLRGKI